LNQNGAYDCTEKDCDPVTSGNGLHWDFSRVNCDNRSGFLEILGASSFFDLSCVTIAAAVGTPGAMGQMSSKNRLICSSPPD